MPLPCSLSSLPEQDFAVAGDVQPVVELAHLAEITGVKTTGSDAEKANAFIAAIRQMNREMGLPTGFDFIEQKDFPQIIKWALAEGNGTYPVPVIYNEARMRHVLNRIVLEA